MPEDAGADAAAVIRQELGTLEVAEQVFRDLVRKAVSDVAGVASIGRPAGLFRRGSAAEAVQVERGQGEVAFSLCLSVRYDVSIPSTVARLRRKVKAAVEGSTGYRVRAIHVTVEHILSPEAEPEPDAEPSAAPEAPGVPEQE